MIGNCLFILSLLPCVVFAGASDRGGGNAIGSSVDEVRQGIANAKLTFAVLTHAAAIDSANALNPAVIKNKDVRNVLAAWLTKEESSNALLSDIDKSEYQIQTAKCASDTEGHHDASTLYKRSSPICFSTDLLTRFPNWILDAELVSLMAHEHAHHFGFGEEEASAVQNYIFNAFGLLQVQLKLRAFYNSDLDNYRARAKSYSPPGSPAAKAFAVRICHDMAVLEGFATAYHLNWFQISANLRPVCDPELFEPDTIEQRLRALEAKSVKDLNQ